MEANQVFFLVKGLIALTASVCLIPHTWMVWVEDLSTGRRLRYVALLAASLAITNASRIQIEANLPVDQRAVQGLIVAVLILAAAVVSLLESRHSTDVAKRSSHRSPRK